MVCAYDHFLSKTQHSWLKFLVYSLSSEFVHLGILDDKRYLISKPALCLCTRYRSPSLLYPPVDSGFIESYASMNCSASGKSVAKLLVIRHNDIQTYKVMIKQTQKVGKHAPVNSFKRYDTVSSEHTI